MTTHSESDSKQTRSERPAISERLRSMLRQGPGLMAILLAILASLGLSTLLLLAFGKSPAEAYGAMFRAVFGNKLSLYQTLATTTPLIFTGLAVAVAFRGGAFNIGAEGQLYIGGFAAVILGVYVPMPPVVGCVVCVLVGALAGALWALLPAWFKVRWKAPEVVTTVMFNTIGMLLADYFLQTFFTAGNSANETVAVLKNAELPRIVPQSQLSYGFFLAILMVIAVYYIMRHTTLGLQIRTLGNNPNAARFSGMQVGRISVTSMLISGALAGIAGAVVCLGVYRRFVGGFSPGYGFDGIAVALLANNNPFGILLSAFLFGVLRTGGLAMDRVANVPVDLVDVILGTMIFFIAAPAIFQEPMDWLKKRSKRNRRQPVETEER